MNYTIIILGVIVIILLYILYKYFTTTSVSLATMANLSKTVPPIPMLENSTSTNYAYGIWVSVNAWSSDYKVIFSRPNTVNATSTVISNSNNSIMKCNLTFPHYLSADGVVSTITQASQISLYLDQTKPTLYCYIDQTATSATCPDKVGPIALTTNFPLQTWVYVVVSVQGQYVDLYLQGKLVKSVKLTLVPTQPGDSTQMVTLGSAPNSTSTTTPAWDANVAKFQYYTNSLSPQDVWSYYMSGNGQNPLGTSFSSYGVDIDLTKNNKQMNTFKIF